MPVKKNGRGFLDAANEYNMRRPMTEDEKYYLRYEQAYTELLAEQERSYENES